jgi:uncharacterized protein (DUF697 family)
MSSRFAQCSATRPFLKAVDVDGLDLEPSAGRGFVHELAGVRASCRAAHGYAVAGAEGVVDLVAEVVEGAEQPA